MATIRQSIDIQVTVSTLYSQLTRFEEFPRFLQDVEALRRIGDDRLRWTMRAADRKVEWESIITEQAPERRIAWQNSRVPETTGAFELEPLGAQASRVTLTLKLEPEQAPDAPAAFGADQMAHRLEQDLVRLKKFVESQQMQTAAQKPESATRSENQLPQPDEEEDANDFSPVAEEVAFDQQPDDARRVGQMPERLDPAAGSDASDPAGAMAQAMQDEEGPDQPDDAQASSGERRDGKSRLQQSLERTLPPLS